MRIIKPLPGILPMPGHPLAAANSLWTMNSLGDKVFDLSGNGNLGVHQDPPADWVTSPLGPAVKFDGTPNNMIEIADNPTLQVFSQFSAVIYFKKNCDICKVGTNFYLADSAATVLRFRTNQLSAIETYFTVGTIDDGKWHLAVVCWDGAKTYLIYDGKYFAGAASTGTMDLSGDTLKLGWTSYGFSPGAVGFAAIYNRGLTFSEGALLYRELFCMFPENIMPEFAIAA